MPGLLAYAAAGALKGWGEGIEEAALAKLQAEYKAQDRAERLSDQKELANYKQQLKDGGSPAPKGSGGGAGSSPAQSATPTTNARSTRNERKPSGRLVGEYDIGGVLHGRDANGKMHPYTGPDGQPVKSSSATVDKRPSEAPKVPKTEAPQPPANPTGGPKKGDVVSGYRFLGGNPNDETAWQKVSNAQ